MQRNIHTASAKGRTAIGPTPEAATAELAKLTPIHDCTVMHGEMWLGDNPPGLEITRTK